MKVVFNVASCFSLPLANSPGTAGYESCWLHRVWDRGKNSSWLAWAHWNAMWLGPLAGGQNPKGKGQFCGFSSPLRMHCNAFAAKGIIQSPITPRSGRNHSVCQVCMYVFRVSLYIACCSIVTWWDGPGGTEAWSLGLLLPSVLWHCRLDHLTDENPSPIWLIIGLVEY